MNRRHLPSLSAMQCFEAAARHLSFTRAAEELALTQSAVSKQVAQLEQLLDHTLFHRARKRLALTAQGTVYLDEVTKILAYVDLSTRYMQSYGGENEVLTIATLPTLGARWLLPRLNGFRFTHPDLYLDIKTRVDFDDLAGEDIDVGFFFGPGVWPGMEAQRMLTETVIPVCAPRVLPLRGLTDPTELSRLVLLQLASRPEQWHAWFSAQGYSVEHSYYGPRFDTFEMVMTAAREGCGVALVPEYLAQDGLEDGTLVVPWPYRLQSEGAYYRVVPSSKRALPRVRRFIEWMDERFESRASSLRERSTL